MTTFEFNPNSPPRKNKTFTLHSTNSDNAPLARISTTNAAEDSPTDSSPTRRAKVFTAPTVEAGPSTPAKHLTLTENWDDDFEDKSDTPELSRNHHFKPSALGRHRASSSASAQYAHEEDDDLDRTVTGRLRRPVTDHPLDGSPPPPVPALPAHLAGGNRDHPQPFPRSPSSSVFSLPTTIAGDSLYYGSTAHLYPASRTSSHLPPNPPAQKERERRPAFEMLPVSSSFSSGLAALHEVEHSIHRGSLSRPRTPQTPVSSAPSSPAPSPIPGLNTTPLSNRHGSPPIPPPSTPSGAKNALLSRIGSVKKWGVRKKRISTTQQERRYDSGRPASSLSSLPLSTTSSRHDNTPPSRPVSPRPPRQNGGGGWFFRASDAFHSPDSAPLELPPPPPLPPTRVAAGTPRASVELEREKTGGGGSSSRTGSKTGHTRTPSRSRTPFSVGGEGVNVNGVPETPSKLIKRRSLGFVVRKTLTGLGNGHGDGGLGGLDGLRVEGGGGQPRHASYGAVSATATKGQFKAEGTPSEEVRGRKTLVKGRKKRPDSVDADKAPTQSQDAGKSFIRSVRRISIVGRHKRQKSGTTTTTIPPAVGRPSLGSQPESMALPVQDAAEDISIQTFPGPLPTVEPQRSSSEAEVIYQPEDPDSHIIKPSLPQTPRKTGDPRTPPMSPKRSSPTSPGKGPTSPQSASLGRSAYSPTRKDGSPEEKSVLRRNSLGDLKIPARITQAQVGLRRDLGMVRDFAQNVEQLKGLQGIYHGMVVEIQALLDRHAQMHSQYQQQLQLQQLQAARSISPTFFSRPVSRRRSNTNPGPTPQHVAYKQLASEFYTINSKYRITWECAELLIELGGGSSTGASYGPKTSVSAPIVQGGSDSLTRRLGRERAITLAGDESRPPSPLPGQTGTISSSTPSWRASSRQELTQRQMVLLKELLNSADPSFIGDGEDRQPTLAIPEEHPSTSVNKDWKWGDPSNSTVTLPPSESCNGPAVSRPPSSAAGNKKRRASRLGMAGLRDLLKMLKRHHTAHPAHPMPSFGSIQASTSSLTSATNSSSEMYLGYSPSASDINHAVEGQPRRRRAETSVGPESSSRDLPSLGIPSSLFDSNPLPIRQSRGRPSLAAIFRIPNSFKSNSRVPAGSSSAVQPDDKKGKGVAEVVEGSNSNSEEDWDRIEKPGDLDTIGIALGDGSATVRGRGRSPYLQQPPPSSFGGTGRTSPRPRATANSSQTSLYEDSPSSSSPNVNMRVARLSNVDEDAPSITRSTSRPPPPSPSGHLNILPLSPPPRMSSGYFNATRKPSNRHASGSVRSMPPQPNPDLKLAMAPENIKPLLENAKEVHARLVECIAEIRALLENYKSLLVPPLESA
ncbi:hypothetical protein F5887DRAFT_991430 [Amanita rubescens]|nr:hypothetical protein F5887DRAFT_991430 [Amanita rubescens]